MSRIAAQRRPRLGAQEEGRQATPPNQIPEDDRDYYLERKYPRFGNLVPRDVASPPRQGGRATKAAASARDGLASISISPTPSSASAKTSIRERYGNLFDMYEQSPTRTPTRSRCASTPPSHYTMGGLWVDYNLMSNIPGLFVLGEANFSDHGANRLGASALMQGLADGYFVIPYTVGDYLAGLPRPDPGQHRRPGLQGGRGGDQRRDQALAVRRRHQVPASTTTGSSGSSSGTTAAWPAKNGLAKAISEIPALREEFEKNVRRAPRQRRGREPVPGEGGPCGRLLRARRAENFGACEAVCPKSIPLDLIALMNRDYLKSKFKNRKLGQS